MYVKLPKVGLHGMLSHSSSRITRRRRLDCQSFFDVAYSSAVEASTNPPIKRFVWSGSKPERCSALVNECVKEIRRSSPPGRNFAMSSIDFLKTFLCSGEIPRCMGTMSGRAFSCPWRFRTLYLCSSYVSV